MKISQRQRDMYGGGVAIVINKKLHPQEICIETICELVSVRICAPENIVLICVYRLPSTSMCSFAKEMNEIIKLFEDTELCIIGDINEDVSFRKQNMSFIIEIDRIVPISHKTNM